MTTVLDELSSDEDKISLSDVRNRVENWKTRIDELYDEIDGWLPDDLTADRSATVAMHEELMKKYGVAATLLPILTILSNHEPCGKIVPRGLWIIGANGRLDFYYNKKHYLVVDHAENLASPKWQIASARTRRDLQTFNCETFRAVIDHERIAGHRSHIHGSRDHSR